MKIRALAGFLLCIPFLALCAKDFTGPNADGWVLVNTNRVQQWQQEQQKLRASAYQVWPGVVADCKKREVRVIAEAVGHRANTVIEFLLIAAISDRAYESIAVSLAKPSDVVYAMESLGLKRGISLHGEPFYFWPQGEFVAIEYRRVDAGPAAPFQALNTLITDSDPEHPLIDPNAFIFTGGTWTQKTCHADSQMPSSIVSLYNMNGTIFDISAQISQGAAYGRSFCSGAVPYGTLLEFRFKPMLLNDQPRVMPLAVQISMSNQVAIATCSALATKQLLCVAPLKEALAWMKTRSGEGHELFVTLDFDRSMTIEAVRGIAELFFMLDGNGLKINGRSETGLYPRAFLPQDKWREREGRSPQPFEIHLSETPEGALKKELVFVEEDWSVAGLDPKLTPKIYPFNTWEELPTLVNKLGDEDTKKVQVLFVFAPKTLKLSTALQPTLPLRERLPLVYIFGE